MEGKLRIVHCFRSPIGGIFRHVRDLCAAQAAAGHDVGIVCDSSTGGAYEDALFRQIEPTVSLGVWRTPMQRQIGPGDLVAARHTFTILKQLRPDILHGHGAKGGFYSRLFGSCLRVSRVRAARLYSPHGGSLHYDAATLSGRFYFLLERMLGHLSDHVLFVSRHEMETYRRKIGTPASPYSVVYNGLAASEFEPVPLAPDAADFLYIGMMRDLKGPDIFIEALARTQEALGRPLSAAMVGDGDGLPRYIERARELGLAIRFFKPMPARDAFALGRMIVVPSRAEAMPYIVLEALAAGKPMIASAVGGIPEIFAGHASGLIEPDVADLSARMAHALSDEAAFAAAMPPADSLRSRFGADVMAARIEDIYRGTLPPARLKPTRRPQDASQPAE
ncbi:glycosyltransferase family 4 protein [Mesorhizobium xinjiangense]|uniref:glycosyltransferase family 4 protein n=1 Tax=Mesorhizobium xinjiangense TaxID=2678685 RepID=UPI0012EEA9D2|nr:glycosyltransferase family 4 protein [Mesorhizobium xinjiangense]